MMNRYVGRCVTIQAYGNRRYIGKLIVVLDDVIALGNASVFDDYEGSRWQDETTHWNIADGVETGFAETVIALNSISAITSSDTDGLEPIEEVSTESFKAEPVNPDSPDQPPDLPRTVELRVSRTLIGYVGKHKEIFFERLNAYRDQINLDYGMILPRVRLIDAENLGRDEYSIVVLGTPRAGGEVQSGMLLACGALSAVQAVAGLSSQEPWSGREAVWIKADEQLATALDLGLVAVEPIHVMLLHLQRVIMQNLVELFSYETTSEIINELSRRSPALVYEFISSPANKHRIHEVLMHLIEDGMKLSPMPRIVESIALSEEEHSSLIVSDVRRRLAASIVQPAVDTKGVATRWLLAEEIATELPYILESPELTSRLVRAFNCFIWGSTRQSVVIVVADDLRIAASAALRELQPDLIVISTSEFESLKLKWRELTLTIDQYCGLQAARVEPQRASVGQ